MVLSSIASYFVDRIGPYEGLVQLVETDFFFGLKDPTHICLVILRYEDEIFKFIRDIPFHIPNNFLG